MKRHGRKTEEPIYYHFSKLSRNEEGNSVTLPFIDNVHDLAEALALDERLKAEISRVSLIYPLRISSHYLSLIDKEGPSVCPVGRQALPSAEELADTGEVDPLNEKESLKTPVFIKRYPGRGVFLVSAECAMYCRFCNRRRLVGKGWNPALFREETLDYLEEDGEIQEVILSGGDPFMLPSEELAYVLGRLKGMGKRTVRISTRMPVVAPERLSGDYYEALDRWSPLWVVIHINHPAEITTAFVEAVRSFRKAGASLVSQTVLLRGVNDCPHILGRLFEELVSHGVKPYYLFQFDEVKGACHFKVRIDKAIDIMRTLRKTVTGLAVPHLALDITGGLGKVPLDYRYIKERRGGAIEVESPLGGLGTYADDGEESRCMGCGLCGRDF